MPKTAEEVLTGVLSTTLKLDEAGVASLKEEDGSFKDDAPDTVSKLYSTHINTVKGDVDAAKRERYSHGKKEALESLERELMDEFGYKDATKKGKELIKAIIAEKLDAAASTDEAKIKASKPYLTVEQELRKEREEREAAIKAAKDEVRAELQGERDTQTVLDEALVIFEAWQPVLPGDAERAANQKRVFLDQLRSGKFQVTRKDGKVDILPMKPDGSGRLEDDHGHPISLKELVEHRASKLFEKRASEDRSTAPNPNTVGSGSGGGSVKYPATMTRAEHFKAMDAATSLPKKEDREAAVAALKKVAISD